MMVTTAIAPGELLATGRVNRFLGWSLMLAGLALTALLAPGLFGPTSASAVGALRWGAIQHAIGVALGMALLQLAVAETLATMAFTYGQSKTVAFCTAMGALLYAVGYGLGLRWQAFLVLVPLGSALNLVGFLYLCRCSPQGRYAWQIKMLVPVACLGMLLDMTAGLLALTPDAALQYLGSEDGVRLRMLRLARVAAIALSALTLLYYSTARGRETADHRIRWGGRLFVVGAIGMPATLAAACFTSLHIKYLLVLPATAVLASVLIAIATLPKDAHGLERWGWLLIALSISVGMVMGLYAFEGPLPTPEFLGDYNQWERRLSRLGHSYSILLGIVALFLAFHQRRAFPAGTASRLGPNLFIVGSTVTIISMVLPQWIPIVVLRAGLVTCVVAIAACWIVNARTQPLNDADEQA